MREGDFIPCYHPKLAWAYKDENGFYKKPFFHPPVVRKGEDPPDELKLPCGTCIGCRLEYARQWMLRCSMEAKCWPRNSCWFITLTYDDAHLPISEAYEDLVSCDVSTGEVIPSSYVASLDPDDLKKFLKDLREYWRYHFDETNIRFYACGEYGGKRFRPHYHLSVFNLSLTDLKPRDTLNSGFVEFNSPTIERIWNKGRISVSPFSPETAGYVARYVMKKAQGCDCDFYAVRGLYPEFVRMSRKPGIGFYYLDVNKERIAIYDSVYLNGRGFKPPRYFDKLLLDDSLYKDYVRTNHELRRQYSLSALPPQTSLYDPDAIYKSDSDQYLSLLESIAFDRVKKLPRVGT